MSRQKKENRKAIFCGINDHFPEANSKWITNFKRSGVKRTRKHGYSLLAVRDFNL